MIILYSINRSYKGQQSFITFYKFHLTSVLPPTAHKCSMQPRQSSQYLYLLFSSFQYLHINTHMAYIHHNIPLQKEFLNSEIKIIILSKIKLTRLSH